MKYLLIDGNNLAIRSAFANAELKNTDGIPTGVHYGVMTSLIGLKEKFPDYQFLISWDSKSKRRMDESLKGVSDKLIKSAYKENRVKDEQPKALLDFYEQADFLKRGIEQLGIPQIKMNGFETDDVIATYARIFSKNGDEVVCMTSDEDYLQLLDKNITIWDGMKQKTTTLESFEAEYGIKPDQYVDVGALMGDSGDNIFGIPGWGIKTSLEAIKKYGSYKKMYEELHSIYDPLREKYPDVKGEEFTSKFSTYVTEKGNSRYSEVTDLNPYTGVIVAFEEKTWKPPTKEIKSGFKSSIMALAFEKRVHLAYSLKAMDFIDSLPSITPTKFDINKLNEYLDYYEIVSIKDRVEIFENNFA